MKRVSGLKKKLDFWVGVPIVSLLGLFRRERAQPPDVSTLRDIGILCVAAIGDLLVLSAPLEDLAKQNSHLRIHLFCGPDNYQMAKILQEEKSLFASLEVLSPRATFRAIRQLRARRLDVLVDSGQWSRWTAILSWAARARFTMGFATAGQHRTGAYSRTVPHRNDRHELENFRALLAPWVNPFSSVAHFDKSARHRGTSTSGLVICHLFASGESRELKHWPEQNWAQLIADLNGKGRRVMLSGGPNDRELADAFVQKFPQLKIENRVGADSLAETKKRMMDADLIISVNTGIMHLASSLGRPLLALHGPTNSARWGPLDPNAKILRSPIPCSPCLNLGFEYGCPVNLCMRAIEYKKVWRSVELLLGF